MARLLLGLDPALDPFASQTELAAQLGVTRARVAQQVERAAGRLGADDPACRDLLDAHRRSSPGRRSPTSGGVATVDELAGAVRLALASGRDRTDAAPPTGSRRACCASPWTGRRP